MSPKGEERLITRSLFHASMAGVAIAVAVVALSATAAVGVTTGKKAGKLKLDSQGGSVLPTRGGKSAVDVKCKGRPKARCNGRVQLIPRGSRTRELVGDSAIARTSVKLKRGQARTLQLPLRGRAQDALGDHVLNVTVRLTSKGKSHPTKRASSLFAADKKVGHDRPSRVKTDHPPNGHGGTDTVKTYHWSWDIPVRKFLVLPDFRCPSEAPNVVTNGTEIQNRKTGDRLGLKAGLDVQAKTGTGYGGFNVPHLEFHQGQRGNYPDYDVMTGWPEGGWTYNSIWAPVAFEDGHFELTVSCTSSTDRNQIAYKDHPVAQVFLFPWGA